MNRRAERMESTSIMVDLTVASIAEGRILKHDTVRIETIRNSHSSERNVVMVIVVVIIIIIIVASTFQCWFSRGGGFLDVFSFRKGNGKNVHDRRDACMHACFRNLHTPAEWIERYADYSGSQVRMYVHCLERRLMSQSRYQSRVLPIRTEKGQTAIRVVPRVVSIILHPAHDSIHTRSGTL